jgi:hypothetical protein
MFSVPVSAPHPPKDELRGRADRPAYPSADADDPAAEVLATDRL